MANVLDKVAPILLAQGMMALRNYNVMPRLVNSDYQGAAQAKNQVINVPIPSAVVVNDVVPGVNPPPAQDSAPKSVDVKLDQWKEAPFYLTDKEIMETVEGVTSMQTSKAIKAIADKVNGYLLSMGKKFYGFVGTPGTTPFASDIKVAAEARKALNNQLAGKNDRRLVLDLDAETNALVLPQFQNVNQAGTDRAQVEGEIGRKLGFDWYADQQVLDHISTPLTAGAATVNGAHGVGATIVSIAKATNASPLIEGDIITFAGHDQTYVVVADRSLIIGNTNVEIYPALKAPVAGGSAVALKASHTMNLAFHRDAIAFATRPLAEIGHPAEISLSQTDENSGLSMRLCITREHKQTRFAYDILYGAQVVRRELGARIAG